MTAADLAALHAALLAAERERERLWKLYCEASQREVLARAAYDVAWIEAERDEDDNG